MTAVNRDTAGVVALAACFAFAALYKGAVDTLPILAYAVLFLIVSVVAIFSRGIEVRAAWSLTHTVAVAYIAFLALSLAFSTLPENSFIMFWVLASLPAAFLVASQLNARRWRMLFGLLLAVGASSALWGIVVFVATKQRASGPLIDPNAWAAMLNMLFFGLLAGYLAAPSMRRSRARLIEALLLLLAIAFFSAYSRAASVVWLAAFLFLGGWVLLRTRVRRPLVTAVLLSCVAFALVHGYASQVEASHAEGYTLDVEAKGWRQRFAQWDAALAIYAEHPVTGSGLGTFKVHYPRHRTQDDVWTLGNYAHNDYLQFLQEGGPILLLILIALVALLARGTWRQWTGPMNGEEELATRTESLGLSVAIGTSLVHSLLTFTQYQLPVALLSGVYLGRIMVLGSGDWAPALRDVRLPLPGPALGLVLLIPWSLLAMDSLSYALVYGQRWVPFARSIEQDPLRFHDTLQMLATLRPGTSVNHAALATIYRKLMEAQEDPANVKALGVAAAIEYQRSLAANPYQYMMYVYYADLLDEQPAIRAEREVATNSVEQLERAIEIAPIYLEPYTALAERYEARGESEKAYRLLKERALPWVDLQYWRYEEARLRFAPTMISLARRFGDLELAEELEGKLGKWQAEWQAMRRRPE